MIESKPIPKLATSASQMALAKKAEFDAGFQLTINLLANETVEAMGLDPALKWTIDFDAGTASREVPEAVPSPTDPAGPPVALLADAPAETAP